MAGKRKYATMCMALTFLVVGGTGMLFQFFFKNHALMELHGWIGVAMVAAALVHISLNWRPMVSYLRDWRTCLLLIPVVLICALSIPGEKGEQNASVNPRHVLGKLSQASAADLAKVFGKDVNAVMTTMTTDGMKVAGSDVPVQQLARENHKSPEVILNDYFLR